MLKKSMIDLETIMLREFGFIVHVDHPHKLVLNHLNLLHQGVQEPQARTRLMQEAFSLTNDRCALPTSQGCLTPRQDPLSLLMLMLLSA